MKILLVEDDRVTGSFLSQALTNHQYTVDLAKDGQQGLDLAFSFNYDLILLDLLIPKVDGIRFCQQLRSRSNETPILLLTAKDSTKDKVKGLEAGADDYLVKPFELPELIARIRALLRRKQVIVSSIITWENLYLDTNARQVRYGENLLHLTPKEYGILELMLRNPRQVFSRSAILDNLWDFAESPGEETVTSHIKTLRQKLKAAGATQDLIETVYGLGYRLKVVDTKTKPSASKAVSPIQAKLNPEQAEANEFMADLWEEFKHSFTEQIKLLKRMEKALSQGKLTWELQQQAKQESHKLAGSFGVFGYDYGSQLARQLEGMLASSTLLTAAVNADISNLIKLICQQLEEPPTFSTTVASVAVQFVSILTIADDRLLVEQLEAEVAQWNQQNSSSNRCFTLKVNPNLNYARKTIAQSLPNIILLDLTSANDNRQDKLTFLQEIGQQEKQIPILILTDRKNLAERVEITRRGGRTFLQKPIAPEQIFQTINQILDRSPSTEGKVLIVDDDPIILASVSNLLQSWGLQVKTLEKPEYFLEVLNNFAPNLLLLDLEMPKFSGIELCEVVRNDPEWGDLPVLFLTSHTETELIYKAFAVGADDYIRKPIVEPELVTRVISRLDRIRLLQKCGLT